MLKMPARKLSTIPSAKKIRIVARTAVELKASTDPKAPRHSENKASEGFCFCPNINTAAASTTMVLASSSNGHTAPAIRDKCMDFTRLFYE